MVKQYPHYLFVVSPSGAATQNTDGEWETAATTVTYVGACREETNGRGAQIAATDGKYFTFQSLIQMPSGTTVIPVGTTVIVCDDAAGTIIRVKGTCMKFDVGQLHCRLWL